MSFVTCISFQALHRNCRLSPSGPRKCTTLTVSFWFMQMLSTTVTKSTVGFIRTPPAPTRSAPIFPYVISLVTGVSTKFLKHTSISMMDNLIHSQWLSSMDWIQMANSYRREIITKLDNICSGCSWLLPFTAHKPFSMNLPASLLVLGYLFQAPFHRRNWPCRSVNEQHSSEGPGISAKGMHQHTTHGKGVKWFPALLP